MSGATTPTRGRTLDPFKAQLDRKAPLVQREQQVRKGHRGRPELLELRGLLVLPGQRVLRVHKELPGLMAERS